MLHVLELTSHWEQVFFALIGYIVIVTAFALVVIVALKRSIP